METVSFALRGPYIGARTLSVRLLNTIEPCANTDAAATKFSNATLIVFIDFFGLIGLMVLVRG
jgi:hypothetical protein